MREFSERARCQRASAIRPQPCCTLSTQCTSAYCARSECAQLRVMSCVGACALRASSSQSAAPAHSGTFRQERARGCLHTACRPRARVACARHKLSLTRDLLAQLGNLIQELTMLPPCRHGPSTSASNVGSWRDAYFHWKDAGSKPPGAPPALPSGPRAQTAQEGWRRQYYSWRAQPYAPPGDGDAPAQQDSFGDAHARLSDACPPPLPSPSGLPPASRAFSTSSIVPFNLQPTSYRVIDGRLMPLHGLECDSAAGAGTGALSDAACCEVRAHCL